MRLDIYVWISNLTGSAGKVDIISVVVNVVSRCRQEEYNCSIADSVEKENKQNSEDFLQSSTP